MKTPPEGLDERNAVAIRRLLPGSAGGRSRLVAPVTEPKKATVQPPGVEGPLPPWGYAGDEGSYNGWHSIHETAEAALAGDAPYLTFGIAPLEDNAVGFGGRLTDDSSTDYWQLVIEDDYFWLEAQKSSSTDVLKGDLILNGAGNDIQFSLEAENQDLDFDVYLGSNQVYLDMFTGASNQAFMSVQDDGDTYLRLLCAGTGQAWFEMNESPADPPAPLANRARWFLKDNGAGKTGVYIRFATGAVQGPIALQP